MQDLPKRRAEATLRKQVRLTGETIERIHAWRTTQGGNCSFSAAIEALARIGLGDDPSTAFMSVMVSMMRRQFETLSNRLARLASHSAIESGIASRLTGFLVLRTPTTKELMHPQAYERLRQLARRDAAWLLRRSLREAMPEIFEAWIRDRCSSGCRHTNQRQDHSHRRWTSRPKHARLRGSIDLRRVGNAAWGWMESACGDVGFRARL